MTDPLPCKVAPSRRMCARAAGASDPLAALRSGPGMAALVDGFSLLAIATSYIGFVLGLTDFLSDLLQARPALSPVAAVLRVAGAACLFPLVVQVHTDSPQGEFAMPYRLLRLSVAKGRRELTSIPWAPAQLPSGQRQVVPYLLTTLPPFLLALAFPALFFSALDFAGCYGVLTLFGLLPVAMAWSERYQVRHWRVSGWSVVFAMPWHMRPSLLAAYAARSKCRAAVGVLPSVCGCLRPYVSRPPTDASLASICIPSIIHLDVHMRRVPSGSSRSRSCPAVAAH